MRFFLSILLVVCVCGCSPAFLPSLDSKAAGYSAPADFTRGVGEAKFTQSTDGKTVFWEIPYYNDTDRTMFCTASPMVTVKDDAGKIVWVGKDAKNWAIPPGGQGFVGGKIVIPEEILRPTLKWEIGGVPSAEFRGEAATK